MKKSNKSKLMAKISTNEAVWYINQDRIFSCVILKIDTKNDYAVVRNIEDKVIKVKNYRHYLFPLEEVLKVF